MLHRKSDHVSRGLSERQHSVTWELCREDSAQPDVFSSNTSRVDLSTHPRPQQVNNMEHADLECNAATRQEYERGKGVRQGAANAEKVAI